jgi:MFS family permease
VTHTEHRSFAALRHAGYRWYFIGNATAMLADNTEHVISYWVIFQKFHSAALAGFAVVSHWVPFLLFSVYAGALADRFDPRRIIQLGMLLFIGVSLAWGLLFYTNALELWQVMLLLVIHGIAGVLWNPPSQLLLHDVVGPEDLQSAVRLNATGRYLGILIGPALGSALLLVLGPALGMFVNALVYLPLTLWLWKAPYGPKFRSGQPTVRAAVRGFGEIFATARTIAGNRTVILMTLLSGSAAFFIGNSYQAQMPGFAVSLGHGDPGMSYGALLAADAAGALTAGLILEGRGLMPARVMTALVLAMLWCVALISFALTNVYPLALVLLFAAGFLELSFNAMSQTLVQLNAPAEIRGRVIGMFSVASLGMRAFSGVTVGLVGSAIGIHWSLALSAGALWIAVSSLFFLKARRSTVSTA